MAPQRSRWLRFSVRALLLVTYTFAVFFAGYRLGFHSGREAMFDGLIELIQTTINPGDWEEIGGPASVRPMDGDSTTTEASTSDATNPRNQDSSNEFDTR